jgi:uncharacterized protein (DUF302 family)
MTNPEVPDRSLSPVPLNPRGSPCARWRLLRWAMAGSLLLAPVHQLLAQTHEGSGTSSQRVTIEHLRIVSALPFADVKAALEAKLKRYDGSAAALIAAGEIDRARAQLEQLASPSGLTIMQSLNHGLTLAMVGPRRNAVQYGIGNILIAVEMTKHNIAAGLYAPIRVILYEGPRGNAVFEYDKPSTTFSVIDNAAVTKIAKELDGQLRKVLLEASVLSQ